jgi:hypothetical protein
VNQSLVALSMELIRLRIKRRIDDPMVQALD